MGAESALRVLGSGAEVAAADVLVAAAMVCPNKLPDGIPNAGAANELPALPDWPNKLLDGVPKAGAAKEFPAALDAPKKLLDGIQKAGAASELPAVLDCPNKPLGCRPSDAAVVLAAVFAGADVAAVFAGADVAAVFAGADVAAVFAGADVAAGARLDDGRACEADREEAEDWKRPAVADAAGKPPGCGGFCTHITEREAEEKIKKKAFWLILS